MTRRLAPTTARTGNQTPTRLGSDHTLAEVALFVGTHAAAVAATLALLAAPVVALSALAGGALAVRVARQAATAARPRRPTDAAGEPGA